MGKKIIDFVMRRDAWRGRKSKAGGGIKSKAAQLYTPLDIFSPETLDFLLRGRVDKETRPMKPRGERAKKIVPVENQLIVSQGELSLFARFLIADTQL